MHRLQSALLSPLAKLPALQLIGTTDPATQKAPTGQATQLSALMALVASEKVPAAHGVHSDWPVAAVNVPGEHGVFVVDPVAQDEPAGHAVHSDADPSPVLLE